VGVEAQGSCAKRRQIGRKLEESTNMWLILIILILNFSFSDFFCQVAKFHPKNK
jgi:hypothetical protein